MVKQNYVGIYKSKTFYKETILDFKNKISCFGLFSDRVIEGNAYRFKNSTIVDIGFKYFAISKEPLTTSQVNLKVIKLESVLNDLHSDYIRFKEDLIFKLNWSLIKKAFIHKCFLKGRILNPLHNGFSVGVCGFVGFMPKKYSVTGKPNLRSVFVVVSIDYLKNTFVLSQNKIDKTSPRTLFRLSSQLSYISKK